MATKKKYNVQVSNTQVADPHIAFTLVLTVDEQGPFEGGQSYPMNVSVQLAGLTYSVPNPLVSIIDIPDGSTQGAQSVMLRFSDSNFSVGQTGTVNISLNGSLMVQNSPITAQANFNNAGQYLTLSPIPAPVNFTKVAASSQAGVQLVGMSTVNNALYFYNGSAWNLITVLQVRDANGMIINLQNPSPITGVGDFTVDENGTLYWIGDISTQVQSGTIDPSSGLVSNINFIPPSVNPFREITASGGMIFCLGSISRTTNEGLVYTFFNNQWSIVVDTNNGNNQVTASEIFATPYGYNADYLYWARFNNGGIYRSSLNGPILSGNLYLNLPSGIVFDFYIDELNRLWIIDNFLQLYYHEVVGGDPIWIAFQGQYKGVTLSRTANPAQNPGIPYVINNTNQIQMGELQTLPGQ